MGFLDWPEKAFYSAALLIWRLVLVALLTAGTALAAWINVVLGVIVGLLLLLFLGAQWTPQDWRREQ